MPSLGKDGDGGLVLCAADAAVRIGYVGAGNLLLLLSPCSVLVYVLACRWSKSKDNSRGLSLLLPSYSMELLSYYTDWKPTK